MPFSSESGRRSCICCTLTRITATMGMSRRHTDPTMTDSRVLDLTSGVAMIVTDLHGDFDLYRRYRDRFLQLHAWGFAQTLVFCGDLIHSDGPAHEDRSLQIVLDVLSLQERLGSDLVVLLGNHEMPHIYGVTLARGDIDYTPRFEAAMGAHRAAILALFKRLPFYARTQAGVMIAHAGAPPLAALPGDWDRLRCFDHDAVLRQAEERMQPDKIAAAREEYARIVGSPYDDLARRFLSIAGPDDPRYNDLLRAVVIGDTPDFNFLWSALFTRNEYEFGEPHYARMVEAFLRVASLDFAEQRVLVAGHIPTRGRKVVGERQLRLFSGAYDGSIRDASYLLLDVAEPAASPYDLLDRVHRIHSG